jgi:cytochrome c oxidase assembly protein subunit 15
VGIGRPDLGSGKTGVGEAAHTGVLDMLGGVFELRVLLRLTALASLVANIGIVVTGGAVRLTGSGLGCPTWPKCTKDSLTATRAMGVHGAIEFGNRTLTFVLAALAIAGFVLAWLARRNGAARRSQMRWALIAAAGIPAQAVWGGLTVLTDLNPWIVGLHFMVSIGVICAAFGFWRSTVDGAAREPVTGELRLLAGGVVAVVVGVLVIGTMVTGSGPHAGDASAKRNGLDPAQISQVHADLVFLLFGLAVAAWLALRAARATNAARATLLLVVVMAAQGLIGFVQYFTHLLPVLVGAHMLGASLVWVAALRVWWALAPAGATPSPVSQRSADRADYRPPVSSGPGTGRPVLPTGDGHRKIT